MEQVHTRIKAGDHSLVEDPGSYKKYFITFSFKQFEFCWLIGLFVKIIYFLLHDLDILWRTSICEGLYMSVFCKVNRTYENTKATTLDSDLFKASI